MLVLTKARNYVLISTSQIIELPNYLYILYLYKFSKVVCQGEFAFFHALRLLIFIKKWLTNVSLRGSVATEAISLK